MQNKKDLDSIRIPLEWAGSRLLLLDFQSSALGPRPVTSSFPLNSIRNQGFALGLELHPPSAWEIDQIESIFFQLLSPALGLDSISRKIIQSRSLVHPLNRSYLFPWSRLGLLLHLDRKSVRYRWEQGAKQILTQVGESEISKLNEIVRESEI